MRKLFKLNDLEPITYAGRACIRTWMSYCMPNRTRNMLCRRAHAQAARLDYGASIRFTCAHVLCALLAEIKSYNFRVPLTYSLFVSPLSLGLTHTHTRALRDSPVSCENMYNIIIYVVTFCGSQSVCMRARTLCPNPTGKKYSVCGTHTHTHTLAASTRTRLVHLSWRKEATPPPTNTKTRSCDDA